MTLCGTQFCVEGSRFYMYGATFYQQTPQSGIDNPTGTIALAQQEKLNTIRIVNFYSPGGDPSTTPFSPAVWQKVDVLIADAEAAHIRVVLDLSDYRNALWDHCINPYTADWSPFLQFVASRVNTVTGAAYGADPEILMTSFAGEPLEAGSHTFTGAQGASCTLTYTTEQLTTFYATVEPTGARSRRSP